ncbi:MAG: hypothetical protein KKH28_06595 [Elusimicrobia bacterium]|nr:hypothetical protein [Elusimicrobiota bacterium]
MKKAVCFVLVSVFTAAAASAYFDGSVGMTTGPDGYTGTDLSFTLGNDTIFVKPGLSAYSFDVNSVNKTYKVYRLRGGMEKDNYTAAAEAGFSSKEAGYEYKYFGADITFSLTPGKGGKGRLAGPSARSASGGGQGVTRVDVGAGIKQHMYNYDLNSLSKETGQTEFSIFSGAKVFITQVSASFTGYSYGSEEVTPMFNQPSGLIFVTGGLPRSSVNVRAELPSTLPMVTPFAGYTTVKYKSAGSKSALQLGGTVNLGMVTGVVSWQTFDGDNFLSISGGLNVSF